MMDLKTLSTVTVGATLVAIEAGAAGANPLPADQFHWSSPIQANGTIARYKNRRNIGIPRASLNAAAIDFIESCSGQGKLVRARGFLDHRGKPEWSKAEFLCTSNVGGTDLPREAENLASKEIKVFGQGPATLRHCEPYSRSSRRIWSECGALVPNDGSSEVLIGDGNNTGRVMQTARVGSGISTVQPVLLPEVERMRQEILQKRLESGYYNRSI